MKTTEIRQQIVDEIVTALEQGTKNWRRTWQALGGEGFAPVNAATGRAYHGINSLHLALTSSFKGHAGDNRYCTFNQAKGKGWKIRKGAKATQVVFFDSVPKTRDGEPVVNDDGNPVFVPMMKYFSVFHASDIDGIPALETKEAPNINAKIEAAEKMIAATGADIRHGGDRAYYSPSGDYVQLPIMGAFETSEDYYATALHELAHWTGHKTRLARHTGSKFGSSDYATEELIAEIASMYLSRETGIMPTQTHFDNHAAYIGNWVSAIRKNPNALFTAAAAADKAANYILNS